MGLLKRLAGLDTRVTIETPAGAQDTFGASVPAWTEVATVWASVQDLTGREYFKAAEGNAEMTTRFKIRWRGDVTAAMRLVVGSDIYDIVSIAEIPRHVGLEIMAVKRQ